MKLHILGNVTTGVARENQKKKGEPLNSDITNQAENGGYHGIPINEVKVIIKSHKFHDLHGNLVGKTQQQTIKHIKCTGPVAVSEHRTPQAVANIHGLAMATPQRSIFSWEIPASGKGTGTSTVKHCKSWDYNLDKPPLSTGSGFLPLISISKHVCFWFTPNIHYMDLYIYIYGCLV